MRCYLRVVVFASFKGFIYEAHAKVSLEPGGRRRAALLHRRRSLPEIRSGGKKFYLYMFKGFSRSFFISVPQVTLPVRISFPVLPLPLLALSVALSFLLSLRVPLSPPLVFTIRLLFLSLLVVCSVFLSLSLFFTFPVFHLLFLLVGFAEAAWQTEWPDDNKTRSNSTSSH